jgi:hypothetical protein
MNLSVFWVFEGEKREVSGKGILQNVKFYFVK